MALGSNYLTDLFFEHRQKTIDKWEHYIAIYSRELAPFLNVAAADSPARDWGAKWWVA